MNKHEKHERWINKARAETLRQIANEIENGFPLTQEHLDMLKKLSHDIVYKNPNSCKENKCEDLER